MQRAVVAVSTIRHDHEDDNRKYFQQDLKIMKRAMVAETTRRHPTMAVPNISSLHSLDHKDDFTFLYLCYVFQLIQKQDHIRMNIAPHINNHLRSIDLFRSSRTNNQKFVMTTPLDPTM